MLSVEDFEAGPSYSNSVGGDIAPMICTFITRSLLKLGTLCFDTLTYFTCQFRRRKIANSAKHLAFQVNRFPILVELTF